MNPNYLPRRGGICFSARLIAISALVSLLAMFLFITVRKSARHEPPSPARLAEKVVAEKISRFAHQRQELVAAMAKRFNVDVPEDVNRFFAAAEAGKWKKTTNLFVTLKKLQNGEDSPTRLEKLWPAIKRLRGTEDPPPGLEKLWPAIMETYGVVEQAHLWPAQELLDYGNAVLDSLRPGMIYVGGTDAGRFIPTLLTDTGAGEPHIVLTQNALRDDNYLEYLRFRYGDRMAILTAEDVRNGFQARIAEVQIRLQHEHDFPDEPKQVMGQGILAIEEKLLKTLLQKNPSRSFALQESFPLKSLYPEATTLGPITELCVADATSALTPERAAQALDYWRSTIQTLITKTDAVVSSTARDNYAKLILGQANLFADRKLSTETEQACQLAISLNPGNPESVFRYVQLLADQKRYAEARQVVETAIALAPSNEQFPAVLANLNHVK